MTPLILLDDVANHSKLLKTLLEEICTAEDFDAQVELATNNLPEVLDYARTSEAPALYFLDIEMGETLNGVELGNRIKEFNRRSHIIYVSAYPNYAMDCLHSHGFDFLLKPLTREPLSEALRAALKDMETQLTGDIFTVQVGSHTFQISYDDIVYFKAEGNLVCVNAIAQSYKWRSSLREFEKQLPGFFIQVSRAVVVNLKQISEVDWLDGEIKLKNGDCVPLSRRRQNELKNRLMHS